MQETAWMLAKITRSSLLEDSPRQLFKFDMTVSSVNCDEQGPSLGPRRHLQLSCRNFLTLANIWVSFSEWSKLLSSSPSIILRELTCNTRKPLQTNVCCYDDTSHTLSWVLDRLTDELAWSFSDEMFSSYSQEFLFEIVWGLFEEWRYWPRKKRTMCPEMFPIMLIEHLPKIRRERFQWEGLAPVHG